MTKSASDNSKSIQNVSDLVSYVQKNCGNGRYLFRGQPEGKPLLPKIARDNPTWDALKLEKSLLEDFMRGSVPCVSSISESVGHNFNYAA